MTDENTYLQAYVNMNGVFIIRKHEPTSKYYLRKLTFGRRGHVDVKINATILEKIESQESFRASWAFCNSVMSQKLKEKHDKKMVKYQGNC